MTCKYPKETITDIIRFHGHFCPGLSIGIRASELAQKKLGDLPDTQMVCTTETDMCGVDAIQYLTGCTFGKGNLIHKDYGKTAFTFFNRKTGQGFRCLFKPNARGEMGEEMSALRAKIDAGDAGQTEKTRFEEIKKKVEERIMKADLDDLFDITPPQSTMPSGARILDSLICDTCGEATMESRIRRFAGKTLCKPCFNKVEQKR